LDIVDYAHKLPQPIIISHHHGWGSFFKVGVASATLTPLNIVNIT